MGISEYRNVGFGTKFCIIMKIGVSVVDVMVCEVHATQKARIMPPISFLILVVLSRCYPPPRLVL